MKVKARKQDKRRRSDMGLLFANGCDCAMNHQRWQLVAVPLWSILHAHFRPLGMYGCRLCKAPNTAYLLLMSSLNLYPDIEASLKERLTVVATHVL